MTRTAQIDRKTAETEIHVSLGLDGDGDGERDTGVGFFEHMLTLLAKHSLIDLTVNAVGDLHIDAHHTVEDVGICFGKALAQALGLPTFRPYHATDVRGVEIGGAAKNVLAIAAGIVAGRKLGTGALAALTTDAGGATTINGGFIDTTGDQHYGDAVTFGGATTVESQNGGTITFDKVPSTTSGLNYAGKVQKAVRGADVSLVDNANTNTVLATAVTASDGTSVNLMGLVRFDEKQLSILQTDAATAVTGVVTAQ